MRWCGQMEVERRKLMEQMTIVEVERNELKQENTELKSKNETLEKRLKQLDQELE